MDSLLKNLKGVCNQYLELLTEILGMALIINKFNKGTQTQHPETFSNSK